MQPTINYMAVAVAAIVRFAVGSVWYTVLFGAKWQEYTGVTEEKMMGESMAVTYGGAFVVYLIQAYVLAHFIHYTNAKDAKGGAQCAFWIWLGFNAALLMQTKLFQAQPIGLFFINAGYELVALLAMGIILAVWQKKATA